MQFVITRRIYQHGSDSIKLRNGLFNLCWLYSIATNFNLGVFSTAVL